MFRISLIFLFVSLVSTTQAMPTQVNGITGNLPSIREGFDFNWLPGETIDTRTGEVVWEINLLTIPGPAGLDLDVNLSLGKMMKESTWDEFKMAGNWQLEVPRIRTAGFGHLVGGGGGQPLLNAFEHACSDPYYYALLITNEPDGDGGFVVQYHNVFHGSGVTFMDARQNPRTYLRNGLSLYPSQYEYVSFDNWLAKCISGGGFSVKSASGTVYTLDKFGSESTGTIPLYSEDSEHIFYATEKQDVHGNTITYTYEDSTHSEDFTGTGGSLYSVTKPLLKTISSSDGRLVEFEYSPGPIRNLKKVKQGTSEWNLEYDAANQLSRIVLPDGSDYVFFYYGGSTLLTGLGVRSIETLRTPSGAVVHYDYEDDPWLSQAFFNDAGFGAVRSISARTLTGPSMPSSTINFSYQNNTTTTKTVLSGDRIEEVVFARQGPKLGYPLTHKVYDGGVLLRTTTLDWKLGQKIGSPPTWVPNPDQAVYRGTPKWLESKVVDGNYSAVMSNFDAFGNPRTVSESGTKTRTTNLTYDNNGTAAGWRIGLLEDETVVGGGTVDRTFNSLDLLTSIDSYGIEKSFEYHATGDLFKEKWTPISGGSELFIKYENYKHGTAKTVTYPDSAIVTRDIDSAGNILWEEDGEGHRTTYEYDGLNRVKKTIPPGQTQTITTRPSPNTKIVSRSYFREVVTFNGLGSEVLKRQYDTRNASDSVYVKSAYNPRGNLAFRSFESSSSNESDGLTFTYDGLDRPKVITNTGDSSTTTYTYWQTTGGSPQIGHTIQDAEGFEKKYYFDVYGSPNQPLLSKLSEQVLGSKYIDTEIDTNLLGDVTEVRQGGFSRTHIYEPGRPRLLKSITHPEVGLVSYTYDNVGNTKTRSIAGQAPITYGYDEMNRLDSVDYPSGTADVSKGYFKNGDIKYVDNGVARWDYLYNGNNQLVSETLSYDSRTFNLAYDYDTRGNLEDVTYPTGDQLQYQPDAMGRPGQVGGYVTDVSYHANGKPATMSYGNGVDVSIPLDNRRFTREIVATNVQGTEVLDLAYLYDDVGNVDSITDARDVLNTRTMSYDGIGRLTSALFLGVWTQGYDYDDVGNLTHKSTPFGTITQNYSPTNNRLQSVSFGASFGYDANGNVVSKGSDTYLFNDANQLMSVPSKGVSYVYDGNGNRVLADRTGNGGLKTYYVYGQNGRLMHEVDAAGIESANYAYLGGLLIAKDVECASVDTDGDGIPDCVEADMGLSPNDGSDSPNDADGDGVSNFDEYVLGSNHLESDSDGDGMDDYYEVANLLNIVQDDSGADKDYDGLTNVEEYLLGTDANNSDSDADGLLDDNDSKPLYNPAWLVPLFDPILFH